MKKLTAILLTAILLSMALSANALSSTTLCYGSKGAAVVTLQQQLNKLGYSAGNADGKFGNSTKEAVIRFQREHNLKADGLAGLSTQNLLALLTDSQTAISSGSASASTKPEENSSSSSSASSGTTQLFGGNYSTISYGMNGDRVKLLQQGLSRAGYPISSIDGKFGSSTLTAVKKFQGDHKLTADGKAGKKTLYALEVALAGGTASNSSSGSSSSASASTSGYTVPTRTLRSGYTGADVTSVQQRLKELGYYSGTVGTSYNTATINSVKAFQTANKLTSDGIAGSKTVSVLFSSAAISAQAAAPSAESDKPDASLTLRPNATGSQVKLMQQALAALGYAATANGTYDNATVSAVKAFQLNNQLTADGVAGPKTLAKLYSGSAVSVKESSTSSSSSASNTSTVSKTTGKGANGATIQLLHWYNDVKPKLSGSSILQVYDPSTGKSWQLKVLSRGHHADCEPVSATDTANMLAAFGGKNTWNQKAIYVRLPDGRWTLASTHDMPHLNGSNSSNNFDGHLCVHFLRDMDECQANDPSYGVANQNTIRSAWKSLTGEVIK